MNKSLEAAQAKMAEMRANGKKIERLDPIEKARRNPASKALAIKAKCWECVGGEDNARGTIQNCTSFGCPLWPHRPFQKCADDAQE